MFGREVRRSTAGIIRRSSCDRGAVALLPYALGLAIWLIRASPLYLAAMRAIVALRRRGMRSADWLRSRPPSPPCSSISATARTDFSPRHCSGGALQLLDRRPSLAGVLIGCLAYKPQFGVADSGRAAGWRAMEHDRRRRRHHRGAGGAIELRDARRRPSGTPSRHSTETSRRPWCSNRATSAGRNCKVDLLGGADVGRERPAAYAVQAALSARRLRRRWPGCGRAMPHSSSRPRRSPPQPARDPTCSITIWCICGGHRILRPPRA